MRAVRFRRKVDPGVLGHGSGRSEEPIAAVAAEPRGAAAPSHSRSYRRSLYNKTSLHRVCWKDNTRCDPCSSPTTPRSPLQEGWTNSRWWWWCRYEKRLPPDLENENAELFDTYLLRRFTGGSRPLDLVDCCPEAGDVAGSTGMPCAATARIQHPCTKRVGGMVKATVMVTISESEEPALALSQKCRSSLPR